MLIFCTGLTIFEAASARPGDKRKREKPGNPGDIEGYKGEISDWNMVACWMILLFCLCFSFNNYCTCKTQDTLKYFVIMKQN